MAKLYIIIEDNQPMDGEAYPTQAKCGAALRWAEHDAIVRELDMTDASKDRDVTKEAAAWAAQEFGDWHTIRTTSDLPAFIQAHISDRDAMACITDARAA